MLTFLWHFFFYQLDDFYIMKIIILLDFIKILLHILDICLKPSLDSQGSRVHISLFAKGTTHSPELPSLLRTWDAGGCLPQRANKLKECGNVKPSGCWSTFTPALGVTGSPPSAVDTQCRQETFDPIPAVPDMCTQTCGWSPHGGKM